MPKKIKISAVDFDKLLEMQCTLEEIAAWMRCSVDTIERWTEANKGMKFAEYSAQIRAPIGRVSLRRALWRTALGRRKGSNPDRTLLIFLAKQYLEMAEKNDLHFSDEELVRIIRKRMPTKDAA